MVAPGDMVLVAISGGPDSTALLHALAQLAPALGIRLRAAHIHHGIRGRAADADREAAAALARALKVPFSTRKADAPARARAAGLSLETAAREVRYGLLDRLAKRCRASRIATGHTLDDQAETVLLNCLRGAGPRGLAGMPPVRGAIIRPLIDISRAEVLRYCETQRLRYRVDRSNADLTHTRNRLRHEIIPALRRVQPAVTSHLARLAAIMRAEDEFMTEQAEAALRRVTARTARGVGAHGGARLQLDLFAVLPVALQRRVVRLAVAQVKGDELDLELERIEALLHLALFGRTGSVVELPGGLRAQRGYGELAIARARPEAKPTPGQWEPSLGWELAVPGEASIAELGLSISVRPSRSKRVPGDPAVALVDADAVQAPLIVRTRRRGDRFRPTGMTSSMKLQDFFVNGKVPREERDRVPLVVSGGEIVWVVGHRVSEAAKVTARTRRTLRLRATRLTQS